MFGLFRLMVGGVILLCSVNMVKMVFMEFVVFNKWFVIDFVEFIKRLCVCLLNMFFIVEIFVMLLVGVEVLWVLM